MPTPFCLPRADALGAFCAQLVARAQRAAKLGKLGDYDRVASGDLGQQFGQVPLPGGPSGVHLNLHPLVWVQRCSTR